MTVGNHIREDPAVADKLLIAGLSQHGYRECNLGERVEQIRIKDQRRPLVVEILSLDDAARIDSAIHSDHQVKWQIELSTSLSEFPEHVTTH